MVSRSLGPESGGVAGIRLYFTQELSGGALIPKRSASAARAAWKPHMPCTPPPGGVDAEHR
jgi:hypothetical protein